MDSFTQIHEPITHSVFDTNGMKLAIDLAQKSQTIPFGCVILDHLTGDVVAKTWGTGMPTNPVDHSEIQAILRAVKEIGFPKEMLKGYTLISTHEPCMMCCGAINHAKLNRVVWGSRRTDLPHLFKNKLQAELLLKMTTHPPIVHMDLLREECIALFEGVSKWD